MPNQTKPTTVWTNSSTSVAIWASLSKSEYSGLWSDLSLPWQMTLPWQYTGTPTYTNQSKP